jgi:hypothetical protein
MKNVKAYKYIILVTLVIFGCAIRLQSWRQEEAKRGCYNSAHAQAANVGSLAEYNKYYETCLKEIGLKE